MSVVTTDVLALRKSESLIGSKTTDSHLSLFTRNLFNLHSACECSMADLPINDAERKEYK
jgi:hypothetical protein